MGKLLEELAGSSVKKLSAAEVKRLDRRSAPKLSTHICPECNGPMWVVEDGKLLHYHCRIGHFFSGQTLLLKKTMALESALWSAVNALNDRANISKRLALRAPRKNKVGSSRAEYIKDANTAMANADILEKMLLGRDAPTNMSKRKSRRQFIETITRLRM